MKSSLYRLSAIALALALIAAFLPARTHTVLAAGAIPLTIDSAYTQNFDTLASTGSPTWTNDSTLPGWYLGTDTNPTVASYLVGTGSGTTGAFYSFGSASATDRALGGLGSNSYYGASGVGKGFIGLVLQNQTGANINALNVAYTGEQWRNGGNTAIQSLTFSYVIASSIPALTAAGTALPALDFASPIHTSTTGALDGNAAANRTALTATISGIIIPDGYYVLLRWTDLNDSGNDHGLAIDDLSVTASTLPIDAAPYVSSTVPTNGATGVMVDSNITINFSEPVNVVDPWFSLNCATSGSHTATVTGGPTTYTIDPDTEFVMGETCTLTVSAASVTDQDTNDPPDNMAVDYTAGFTITPPPLPIGTVNGPVLDTDDGTTHASPYTGQVVTVQGVVYEKTLQATSTGGKSYGIFIQNTAATADSDPDTSDGLFIFMSGYNNILKSDGTKYYPSIGDEIILSGKVAEYFNMTEFSGSLKLLKLVRSGVVIDSEVPPVVANPPTTGADANRYWERLQGMRIQVPTGSIVLGGRNVFSPADAEIWVAAPDSTIAQRTNEFERRAFRDAHPLDDNFDPNNWDGNGYRILMGSLGIKAAAGDAQALIDPARTFDTLTNAPAGGLNYTFSKYRIEISEQPAFAEGPDPAANNPPSELDRSVQFSIVDYNLENLYDYRDSPNSKCDFNGGDNLKCIAAYPFIGDVKPSYNYVPATDADYQDRLTDIATQIIEDLHSPDILMVQEVENQDICQVTGGAIDCSAGDGKPDVLQDLVLKIASLGGPAYDAAYDPNSSDLRGILPAYLYRTERVQLLPPDGDPILGANPVISGYTDVAYDSDVSNPKTLNAVLPSGVTACETNWVFPRAPSVALFRIYNSTIDEGSYRDVYTINNHFKSGPDTCVGHRTEQAKYNAALVAYIEKVKPGAGIVLGGDLNVYPEPDNTALGATQQLHALYDPALGLTNLWDILAAEKPEAAYSYVYLGMAQTLDQMFVNGPMLSAMEQFRIAHINSDFPADYPGDVARGTSDHDPNMATFRMYDWSGFFKPIKNPPDLNPLTAGKAIPLKFGLNGDQGLDIFATGYPQSIQIDCKSGAYVSGTEQTVTAGDSLLTYDPSIGQYIYTWKTDATWAGTCRQLLFVLNDASLHTLDFSFKTK